MRKLMLSLAVALVIASGTMFPSKAHANVGVITAVILVGAFGVLFLTVDTIEAATTSSSTKDKDNDEELSINEIRKELEETKARLEELENPSQ